jgi:hypothetical protein
MMAREVSPATGTVTDRAPRFAAPLRHPAFLPGQSIGHCQAASRACLVLGWWVVAVEASSGEHELRWRLLTKDGNVEITGRDLREGSSVTPRNTRMWRCTRDPVIGLAAAHF